MKKQYHLTREGVAELEQELSALVAERGPIAERIRTARDLGDLSENAEYTSARQEQDKTENRISDIENILKSVEIIEKPTSDSIVQLGSTVTLKNNGKTKTFEVVGTIEADPLEGKISNESPIGQALIGKTEGDKVELKVGGETNVFTIADID